MDNVPLDDLYAFLVGTCQHVDEDAPPPFNVEYLPSRNATLVEALRSDWENAQPGATSAFGYSWPKRVDVKKIAASPFA
jgi:hypothetical protein